MIDIELEFNKSGYDYDKSIDFIDKLPYSIEDASIQPNELSYHKTFNTKLLCIKLIKAINYTV